MGVEMSVWVGCLGVCVGVWVWRLGVEIRVWVRRLGLQSGGGVEHKGIFWAYGLGAWVLRREILVRG